MKRLSAFVAGVACAICSQAWADDAWQARKLWLQWGAVQEHGQDKRRAASLDTGGSVEWETASGGTIETYSINTRPCAAIVTVARGAAFNVNVIDVTGESYLNMFRASGKNAEVTQHWKQRPALTETN